MVAEEPHFGETVDKKSLVPYAFVVHIYAIQYYISCYYMVFMICLQPPILPKVLHDGDATCFDEYTDDDWKNAPAPDPTDLVHFDDF